MSEAPAGDLGGKLQTAGVFGPSDQQHPTAYRELPVANSKVLVLENESQRATFAKKREPPRPSISRDATAPVAERPYGGASST